MNFSVVLLVSFLFCLPVKTKLSLDSNSINKLENSNNKINYRLPNNTVPETYDIEFETNIDKGDFSFKGTVVIGIRVTEKSKNITLNVRQLHISKNGIKLSSNSQSNTVEKSDVDEEREFLVITTKNELNKDELYTLTIKYNGTLRTDNRGFYRSSYVDSSGVKKWLATTHFEPTDARHAFPCYDEPEYKANFTIHITHGKSYHAISNMDGTEMNTDDNEKVQTNFDSTPKMSTYLIAFIISDFEHSNAASTSNITHRVYTDKARLSQASYALSEGVKLLDAISKYLDVPYTMAKMDQALVPDFSSGAMENWGLVTYREQLFLYYTNLHPTSRAVRVTTTISHEFGHQWFGNLVSPKWWSYLWLNEGFATLFEYLGADLIHPDWDSYQLFVANKLQSALKIDAKQNTRPMTYYVDNAKDIAAIFDLIAYNKAGSVLRMFLHAFGEENFKKGLKNYLTKHAYNAADENDLFESLDAAAKEGKSISSEWNVKDIFGSWSNQKGFPLLTVNRNYQDASVTISQTKYNNPKQDAVDSSTWWIPFNYASAKNSSFNDTKPIGWLNKTDQTQVIKPNSQVTWSNDDWLIFNKQQTGYYRVLYDERNYNLINKELNEGDLNKIHPINRAQIIDDLNEFVSNGYVKPQIFCNALTYLKKETSYAPWAAGYLAIMEWKQKLESSEKASNFKKVIKDLVQPAYKNISSLEKNLDILWTYSLQVTTNLACEFDVHQCLQETYDQFKQYIDGKSISPNVRGVILANGIRNATVEEINKLWTQIFPNASEVERNEIIISLGNIANATGIDKFLNNSVADEQLSQTERQAIITTIIGSGEKGLNVTIKFLSNEEILLKVDEIIAPVKSFLSSIASRIYSKAVQVEFFKLLEVVKAKSLCSDNEIEGFKNIATSNLKLQDANLKTFEQNFFTDQCTGSGMQLLTYPALIFFAFVLTRWNFL